MPGLFTVSIVMENGTMSIVRSIAFNRLLVEEQQCGLFTTIRLLHFEGFMGPAVTSHI